MTTTRLSSKGQVIIPKLFRAARHWTSGMQLEVIETDDGLLLKPKAAFTPTVLDDVAGYLSRPQAALSVDDMMNAVRAGVRSEWHDRG